MSGNGCHIFFLFPERPASIAKLLPSSASKKVNQKSEVNTQNCMGVPPNTMAVGTMQHAEHDVGRVEEKFSPDKRLR